MAPSAHRAGKRLGVNIDHVATLRQARRGERPSPLWAAQTAKQAGCDGIVCHLREDRRHIQDRDLVELRRIIQAGLNLEMAVHPDIVRIACWVKPDQATLVPERRQELTTEGGLNLRRREKRVRKAIDRLKKAGIRVSLFIDPNPVQIRIASEWEVPMVELHTGSYAQARTPQKRKQALTALKEGAQLSHFKGLAVAAGHGLDYQNVKAILQIDEIEELNIGFSIVARAIEVGLEQAVREMVTLIQGAG